MGVLLISVGKISMDGIDIYDNLDGWHKPDDRLWEVLEEAQIADLVHSLPGGLDTEIGDRVVRISGGQRQRVWRTLTDTKERAPC